MLQAYSELSQKAANPTNSYSYYGSYYPTPFLHAYGYHQAKETKYFKSAFLKIQNVTTWSVFQNQVTHIAITITNTI